MTKRSHSVGATRLDDALLQRTATALVDEVDSKRVALFGPHSRGDARMHADVELIVVAAATFGQGRSRNAEMRAFAAVRMTCADPATPGIAIRTSRRPTPGSRIFRHAAPA